MKIRLKRLIALFAVCLIFSAFFCSCSKKDNYPDATKDFFVNDFANILSDSTKNEIMSRSAALSENENVKAQAVVATVKTTGNEEISDYALNLGRKWGIGDKDKNNGVLILLATEQRKIQIEVGYGLEGAIPDSKAGRIIDTYGIPYFKEDNFDKGILEIYRSVINEICIEYGLDYDESYTPIEMLESSDEESSYSSKVIISWVVLILIIAIVSKIFGKNTFFFFGGPGSFFGGGFSGRGGGSFGGGGFSGGGGSFGGGGAGRSF